MKILMTNKANIEKVISTLKEVGDFKKKLLKFTEDIYGLGNGKDINKPSIFCLTHFTDEQGVKGILKDGYINVGSKGYISFSATNPFEFKSVTSSKRKYGFTFFLKDLIDKKIALYTPIAYSLEKSIEKFKNKNSEELQKFIFEPAKSGQESIYFLNMVEVRTIENVEIDLCRLFFRNKGISDTISNTLNDKGIFQLPYNKDWLINFFLKNQRWFFENEGNEISFEDIRAKVTFTTEELIDKLENFKVSTSDSTSRDSLSITIEQLKEKLGNALDMLEKNDCFLLENEVSERSVAHKLAEYLQKLFADFNVDCEYNRKGLDKKVLEGIQECSQQKKRTGRIFPDIIVHERNSDDNNLIVIEIKTISQEEKCDHKKLELFTELKGQYKYKLGVFIKFKKTGVDNIKYYINGKQCNSSSENGKKNDDGDKKTS